MDNILELFINNPNKEFYVREISKKLEMSPTTVSKYLKRLQKEGLLLSEEKYNHLFFKANNNLLFKQKKIHYIICKIINSGLIDYLNENFNPDAIVFDRYLNNNNVRTIIVISKKRTDHNKALNFSNFEKKLGKLKILIYSFNDIKNNKELVNRLINGIVIQGSFSLNESIKDRL